jgi:hypothetical protein
MRIVQLNTETQPTVRGSGIYDGRDNALFTSHTGSGANDRHLIDEAEDGVAPTEPTGGYTNNFVQFIRSFRASSRDTGNPPQLTFSRPVNADNVILLSPGPDGKWGNLDDVANFEVLSENR